MVRPAKEPREVHAHPIRTARKRNPHATTPTRHAAHSREQASCGTALTRARQRSPRPPNAATHAASIRRRRKGSRFPKLGSPRRNPASSGPRQNSVLDSGRQRPATSTAPAELTPVANAGRSNARSEPATPPEHHAPFVLRLRDDRRTSPRHTLPASVPATGNRSDGNLGQPVRHTAAHPRRCSGQSTPATSKPSLEPRARSELSTNEPTCCDDLQRSFLFGIS